jgi:L-erythro-3,5-diaminohexanoate dehydrogenase
VTCAERSSGRSLGVHRVLEPPGVLPQAALRLDADPAIGPDEVRIAVERLNLDAASFRQLSRPAAGTATPSGPPSSRSSRARGKMQNPVTGSGGMLIGVVDEVGPGVAARPGRRATGWPPSSRSP